MQKTSGQILDELDSRQAEALTQKRKRSKRWFRDVLSHGTPVVFCTALSIVCLIPFGVRVSFDPWVIPFLWFLPGCFFFVAMETFKLQREIRELRDEVAALRDTKKEK